MIDPMTTPCASTSAMKICTKCGSEKPETQFSKGRGRCNACRAGDRRLWYEANIEAVCKYNHKYREENSGAERERKRKYREENREAAREYDRKRYEANGDAGRERARLRREANPEAAREIQRRYRQSNPLKMAEKDSRRRALKGGLAVVEKIDRAEIYARDRGRCHFCGKRVARDAFHLDHLIPLSWTEHSEHSARNLAVACAACNISSGPGRLPAQLRLVA